MEINAPFYLDVLGVFKDHDVKYILIGGLAVSYHGYSRYTGDMDLWLEPESENLNKLYAALIDLGYPEDIVNNIRLNRQINDPTPIKLKDDQNLLKIDLMTVFDIVHVKNTKFSKSYRSTPNISGKPDM